MGGEFGGEDWAFDRALAEEEHRHRHFNEDTCMQGCPFCAASEDGYEDD